MMDMAEEATAVTAATVDTEDTIRIVVTMTKSLILIFKFK
jgi:hypothetical protein